jgi:hypothetical protein
VAQPLLHFAQVGAAVQGVGGRGGRGGPQGVRPEAFSNPETIRTEFSLGILYARPELGLIREELCHCNFCFNHRRTEALPKSHGRG